MRDTIFGRRVLNQMGCLLFSCIDFTDFGALKVINRVAKETGFPCILTLYK